MDKNGAQVEAHGECSEIEAISFEHRRFRRSAIDLGPQMEIERVREFPRSSEPLVGSAIDLGPRIEILRKREFPSQMWSRQPSAETDNIFCEERRSKHMNLELYRAATKNNPESFHNVLNGVAEKEQLSPVDILNQVTPFNNTLLHVAVSFGNIDTARQIASLALRLLSETNSNGDTPLHISARTGDKSMVETLVTLRGRDLENIPTTDNDRALERETVRDALGMWLMVENKYGNTALHEALINRHEEVALFLISAVHELPFPYSINNEEKSPLCLAVEAGFRQCVAKILDNQNLEERLEGKSPVHAAIMTKNEDLLDLILEKKPNFIHLRDANRRTPLHCAASIGYLDGVGYLLGKCDSLAFDIDEKGSFPIHIASSRGYVHAVEELLKYCPDPTELGNRKGQNILHVAAENGKYNVVLYILNTPDLEKLINEKDKKGDTPLHLSAKKSHPKIVSVLTWDKRVNLQIVNNAGYTARSAAIQTGKMPTFREQLTWAALNAAGAPQDRPRKVEKATTKTTMQVNPTDMEKYEGRVNTLMLMSTLITTVTFAAGFTMPGGNNGSDQDQGMAVMPKHNMFHLFILCDMIAMYSSIIATITLIWAQLGDLRLMLISLRVALPTLGISLTTMSLAFMAGVYLVVSKLHWLALTVLIMGIILVLVVGALFFILWFPIESCNHFLHSISHHIIFPLMFGIASCIGGNLDD